MQLEGCTDFFKRMYPTAEIMGRTIPSYGLLSGIGFVSALLLILWFSPVRGLDRENGIYIYTLGTVGAMAGAKIFYWIQFFPELISDLPYLFSDFNFFCSKYINGGMVFYGGLIGGILTAKVCAKSYRVKLMDYIPVLLPGLALFAGFGRLGCFSVGCCYGKPTDGALAVIFSHSLYAPNGVPLIPTQLLEAGFEFLAVVALLIMGKRQSVKGYLLSGYLAAYSMFRFILEFWRGDSVRGIFLGMSTSQWVSLILLFMVGVSVLSQKLTRKGKAHE